MEVINIRICLVGRLILEHCYYKVIFMVQFLEPSFPCQSLLSSSNEYKTLSIAGCIIGIH